MTISLLFFCKCCFLIILMRVSLRMSFQLSTRKLCWPKRFWVNGRRQRVILNLLYLSNEKKFTKMMKVLRVWGQLMVIKLFLRN